ncbi:signal peptidase I [Aeromicrobium marinum DSM 15272]|uniref:Signal peptidase I n=1 Tax=Aeromicrobium marinum DSM 15272 TaxID=585531 RepID=E2S9D5_9ACTN|nr:signal peptidase I [Aeromicrobium marinum]EFQ83859.1 signal peptidase I [Aeromicrobium marinum DSM 15272]
MTTHRLDAIGPLRWIGQVIAWTVILGVGLVVAAAVVVPRIAGATPYTVLTSSMEPGMPPGTLVVTRPVEAEEVRVGDVITYQLESGRPTVVTHRVVGVEYDLTGELRLITQGDANDIPDADAVLPVQVRGERWYAIPFIGHITTKISNDTRQVATVAVATALVGYAGFMFVGAVRDRRTTRSTTHQNISTEEGAPR